MADTSVISAVRYCDVDPTVAPGIFGAVPNVLLYSTVTNLLYFWAGPADTDWIVIAPIARHVISTIAAIIPANASEVVPRYVKIAAGFKLTISAGADLEIT